MPGERGRDVWGKRTPFGAGEDWPARVDEYAVEEPERWVQSACVLCSNGCGLDIGVKGDRVVGVRGRAADRVNRGRLGPKGLYGWQANNSPDRLMHPLVRRGGTSKRRRGTRRWHSSLRVPKIYSSRWARSPLPSTRVGSCFW